MKQWLVVAIFAAAFIWAVPALRGQMNCAPGANGMMGCGMNMSPPLPHSSASATKNSLKVTATLASPAKTGDNALNMVITNAAGKPITAAKVTAQVGMTSMDMGTTSPSVKETGKGHYTTTVAFSMAGPWRVAVKVIAPGKKPQTTAFDFMAN